jgi:hypothetical protein
MPDNRPGLEERQVDGFVHSLVMFNRGPGPAQMLVNQSVQLPRLKGWASVQPVTPRGA